MYLAQKVKEPVLEEPELISIPVPSNDMATLEAEVKAEEKKFEKLMQIDAHTPEEIDAERQADVKTVVTDLVNYVVSTCHRSIHIAVL